VARIDGASRGNPGPAAYGVVIESEQGAPLAAFSKLLGRTTNNVAEYEGLIAALEYARAHDFSNLKVFSDSELVARQLQGTYKVKSAELKGLYERAKSLIAQLESFSVQHVRREKNAEADRLANQALDGAPGGQDRSAKAQPTPSTQGGIRATATYRKGVLKLRERLPFAEGEELELEVHRKV
jgi:ribonuclease HI